jgi:hypothetical protein
VQPKGAEELEEEEEISWEMPTLEDAQLASVENELKVLSSENTIEVCNWCVYTNVCRV